MVGTGTKKKRCPDERKGWVYYIHWEHGRASYSMGGSSDGELTKAWWMLETNKSGEILSS